MADRTMTLTVPEATYDQLRERADRHARTVEDELRQTIERALVADLPVSGESVPTLATLTLLSTADLRQVIEREPGADSVLLLRALREKRRATGLTEAEEHLARDLVQAYDRAVLLRSRALLLLHQRGEDISSFVGGA